MLWQFLWILTNCTLPGWGCEHQLIILDPYLFLSVNLCPLLWYITTQLKADLCKMFQPPLSEVGFTRRSTETEFSVFRILCGIASWRFYPFALRTFNYSVIPKLNFDELHSNFQFYLNETKKVLAKSHSLGQITKVGKTKSFLSRWTYSEWTDLPLGLVQCPRKVFSGFRAQETSLRSWHLHWVLKIINFE